MVPWKILKFEDAKDVISWSLVMQILGKSDQTSEN